VGFTCKEWDLYDLTKQNEGELEKMEIRAIYMEIKVLPVNKVILRII